jgi:hypothetical protein
MGAGVIATATVTAFVDVKARPHGHSGKLSRLFGCSLSFSVFRYLFPYWLTATITHTDLPPTLT